MLISTKTRIMMVKTMMMMMMMMMMITIMAIMVSRKNIMVYNGYYDNHTCFHSFSLKFHRITSKILVRRQHLNRISSKRIQILYIVIRSIGFQCLNAFPDDCACLFPFDGKVSNRTLSISRYSPLEHDACFSFDQDFHFDWAWFFCRRRRERK